MFSALLLLLIPGLCLAATHDALMRRSTHPKARHLGSDDTLDVRQDGQTFSGRATFFDVGLGACGDYNVPSDFIVALNTPQYIGGSPGPECFKMITITYNGNTQVAQIMDECPTCNYGDLDMSRGLFDSFASEDLGEFQMTWWYNDDAPAAPTTSTPPPPPTTTWVPPTTTSWTPPTTTSWTPTSTTDTPTTTSIPTSTSTTSTTDTPTSTWTPSTTPSVSVDGTPTTASVPAPTATTPVINNNSNLNLLVLALGNIIAAAN